MLHVLARSLHPGSLDTLMQCSRGLALAGLHLLHNATLTLHRGNIITAQHVRSPGSRGRGRAWLPTRTPMRTLLVDSAWLRLLSAPALPSIPGSAPISPPTQATPSIPPATLAPCLHLRCLRLVGLHLDRGAWGQLLEELAALQLAGQLPRLRELHLLRCSLAGPPNPSRRTYSWLKIVVRRRFEAEREAEAELSWRVVAASGGAPPPRLALHRLVLESSGGGLLSALLPHLNAGSLQEFEVGGGPAGEQFDCLASGRLPKLRKLVVATGKAVLFHHFEVLLAHPTLLEVR